ncbi:cytochrome P450 [Lentinula novae-zelandiae]|nr:cytochrome P450 [Lentinula novae-zelandiae]
MNHIHLGTFTLLLSAAGWFIIGRVRKVQLLKNIPGPPPASIWTGNLKQMFDAFASGFQNLIEVKYGRIIRLHGFLGDALLVVADPKALSEILNRHQDVFEESNYLLELSRVSFGPGLLTTVGDHHRKQRKFFSPVFATSNMRLIFPTFKSLGLNIHAMLSPQVQRSREIDMLDWMSRFALDAIGEAGFGHKFNALEGSDDGYAIAQKKYFPAMSKIQHWTPLLPSALRVFSPQILRWIAEFIPWKDLHDVMDIVDIMHFHSTAVWNVKKDMFEKNNDSFQNVNDIKDLMTFSLKANSDATAEDRLPDEELLSETNTLLFAGTDTTSSALSRVLVKLSENPAVQAKLREEFLAVENLTYDALVTLPYLDAVCKETLLICRYPAVRYVMRDCRQETALPLMNPIRGVDGDYMSSITVPKGGTVILNIAGVNCDQNIWGPDAGNWVPERWLSQLPSTVNEVPGVYSHMMTFLAGGRSCLGFKFAEMEMKIVLANLVPMFKFKMPKGKEIIWRTGIIMTPAVKGTNTVHPQLPLLVSLVEEED